MNGLDERVADGLRDLVGRAPVDADVWDDTARYVKKHRQRRQGAAGVVVLLAGVVVVAGAVNMTHTQNHVRVTTSSTVANAPAPATLPAGSVLLAVRNDTQVVALNANGKALGTVYATVGKVVATPQLSNDHKTLWYRAVAPSCYESNGPGYCIKDANVVRVELATGDETVVTHGEAFGVSPDGTKVAVGRKCAQPDRTTCVQVWLHDVASGTESQLPLNPKDPSLDPISTGGWVQMLWSPDGTQVIGVAGHMVRPVAVHFDVPAAGKTASNGTVLDLEQPQANAIAMGDQYSLAWSSHGLLASTNEFGLSPSGATANIVGFQPEDRTSRTPFTQLGPLFSTTTMQLGDVIQPGATMYVVADTAAKGSTSSWSGHPHLYQVKAGGELVNLGEVSPRGGAIVAVPSR